MITIDPHTYDLLKNEYPRYVEDFDFEIVHYLELIGNLDFRDSGEGVTFQEPCHFSLRSDPYQVPLEMLRKVSNVELPQRSGKRTKCCGGPSELLFPEISERVSDDRYQELERMRQNRIVTACPICFSNLNKGPNVIDIGDYLASALYRKID